MSAKSAVRDRALRIPGVSVAIIGSAGWNRLSSFFSPGRSPVNTISMSSPGLRPARRIICRARSTILMGLPMSST